MINPIEEQSNNKPAKVKKVKYEHEEILNQLLKTIMVTRMDEELKMILRMRIWGKYPETFDPMNHLEIAIDIGAKEDQVKSWEAEALYYVKYHIEKNSLSDSIEKFNENNSNKFKLFNPFGGRIIKP